MILIIDDNKLIRMSLKLLLEHSGYKMVVASDQEQALDALRALPVELVISDMNFTTSTSGEEGLELLRKIKVLRPSIPVILITAWGSIPLAVEGMRLGAFDFITKPWDNHLLLQRVSTAMSLSEPQSKTTDEGAYFDRCGIVGESPQIKEILSIIKRIAPTDASVLITGENGTGKELIAQALHANSLRAKGPMVKVNLGGISQSLFESEMFGSAKGAYTGSVQERKGRFEVADKGTIFLDEIGDLDATCQVKMLRVLQEHTFERLGETKPRKVDIRVVSATNADLQAMVREHTFREDLYYRICLINIHVPALRERRSDIPLLIKHFADGTKRKAHFSPEAIDLLKSLPYPGNIRELRNLVERILLLSPSETIDAESVKNNIPANVDFTAPDTLNAIERDIVEEALRKCCGNVAQAAEMLGITRQTLYRRIKKHGL